MLGARFLPWIVDIRDPILAIRERTQVCVEAEVAILAIEMWCEMLLSYSGWVQKPVKTKLLWDKIL